jgi:GMP synthase-like glutamine amidotransferase
MRLHYLQHVAFEDAANIAAWALGRGYSVTRTRLDLGQSLPPQDTFDWLVVMGGPMNVDEHDAYPWLVQEKQFLRSAIDRGVRLLGVCLGAQLIAEVLGGAVTRNRQTEIGWHPVTLTEAAGSSPLFGRFPREVPAFHWHGDTFSIPPGAVRIAASAGCDNQAFEVGRRVVGLQFHWDYSAASIEAMLRHCGDELTSAPGIQSDSEIRARLDQVDSIERLLGQLLDAMAEAA